MKSAAFGWKLKKAGGGRSNYEVLFDALNEMEVYDEEGLQKTLRRRLRDKVRAQKMLGRLTREKGYLYEVLLDSLRSYNGEKFDFIKMKQLVIDARLLKHRSLYQQAEKLLIKAKKLALKHGHQLTLLEINRVERGLVWSVKKKKAEQIIDQLVIQKEEALTALQQELYYQDIYDRLSLLIGKRSTLTDEQKTQLQEEYQKDLFQQEKENLPLFAQLRLLNAQHLYYTLSEEDEHFFDILTEEYEWWEANPAFKKDEYFRYYLMLSNFLRANYRKKNFEIVLQIINSLEERNALNQAEEEMIFRFVVNYKLLYYLNTVQLEKARQMVPQVESGLRRNLVPVHVNRIISMNIGLLYFLLGEFEQSKNWFLRVSKEIKTDTSVDVARLASLLLCICHLELDDLYAFDNLVRAIERQLRIEEQTEFSDFVRLVIANLKRISAAAIFEQATAYKEFKASLDQINEDQDIKKPGAFDEVFIWTISKLKKRSITDTFREIQPTLA